MSNNQLDAKVDATTLALLRGRDARMANVAAMLRENPHQSDRNVARETGASPTTVGKIRAALVKDGAIPNPAMRQAV